MSLPYRIGSSRRWSNAWQRFAQSFSLNFSCTWKAFTYVHGRYTWSIKLFVAIVYNTEEGICQAHPIGRCPNTSISIETWLERSRVFPTKDVWLEGCNNYRSQSSSKRWKGSHKYYNWTWFEVYLRSNHSPAPAFFKLRSDAPVILIWKIIHHHILNVKIFIVTRIPRRLFRISGTDEHGEFQEGFLLHQICFFFAFAEKKVKCRPFRIRFAFAATINKWQWKTLNKRILDFRTNSC